MSKKSGSAIRTAVKLCAFTVFLCLMIIVIDHICMAKYMYNGREPMTETYANFYNMERDSVDVLILGTSHAATGFNPQDLYDAQKLRSYNLASTAQPVWISYYWLKDVASAAYFCFVYHYGDANCYYASYTGAYVRPRFVIAA